MSDSDDTCPMRFGPESREVSDDDLEQPLKTNGIKDGTASGVNCPGDHDYAGHFDSDISYPSPVVSVTDSTEDLNLNDDSIAVEIVPEDPIPANDRIQNNVELFVGHDINKNVIGFIRPIADPILVADNESPVVEVESSPVPTEEKQKNSCPAWVPLEDYESPRGSPKPALLEPIEEEVQEKADLLEKESENKVAQEEKSKDGSKNDNSRNNQPFSFADDYAELPEYSSKPDRNQLDSRRKVSTVFNVFNTGDSTSASSTSGSSGSSEHSSAKRARRSTGAVCL